MIFAYLRVSTEKQDVDRQLFAVKEYVKENNFDLQEENIYSDKITGKVFKREKYLELKNRLQKDDYLIIQDLDRLGRNWDGIKKEWAELSSKGVYIIVINMPLISVMPNEKNNISIDKRLIQELTFSILCYVSQKEVEKISERTKQALKVKKEKGIKLGRVSVWNEENTKKLIELYKDKNIPTTMIPELLGVSSFPVNTKVNQLVNENKLEPRNKSLFGIEKGTGKGQYVKQNIRTNKLSEEQEQELLKDYFENDLTVKQVCEKYNVWRNSVQIITLKALARGQYQPKKRDRRSEK
jgi:DNA invertase Pin-like site-specific DNA recombinase